MSGLDIEGVLAAAITDYLGNYTLPANYARPDVAHETHRDVAKRCGPLIATHVAAVLREQIAAAMLDAWDRGWAARAQSRHGRYSLDHLDDPYRAELAAQLAPSRVPGEESCHCDRTESALVQCPLHRAPGEES